MNPTFISPVSFDYAGAAQATGYSADVIRRAVKAGDLPAHYPTVDGRAVTKPTILADDLRTWVARGTTERAERAA